jgi:hypothetical protein
MERIKVYKDNLFSKEKIQMTEIKIENYNLTCNDKLEKKLY